MHSFVARQPILDRQLRPVAYELLFRQGLENHFPDISAELATTTLIAEQFLSHPIQRLVGEQPCFINFPYSLLLEGMADSLPVERVVIEILEDAEPDGPLLTCIKRLKEKGFKLALDDFTLDPRWEAFLPYIDVIKFDFLNTPHHLIAEFIERHPDGSLTYLAEKVENHEAFMAAKKMGISLFQGYFFSRPEIVKRKSLSASQQTIMQLLQEVNRENIDYAKIDALLTRDVSLSYKLLRYVNNLKYHPALPITSFQQAASYLGKQELRRFISLVTATSGDEHKSSELYRMSMIRARFCELLSLHRKGWTDPSEAFLCGLFSLLDAILDQPIQEILHYTPLSENIVSALGNRQGELAFYLDFAIDYEQMNWPQLLQKSRKIKMTESQMVQCYLDASNWAEQILSSN